MYGVVGDEGCCKLCVPPNHEHEPMAKVLRRLSHWSAVPRMSWNPLCRPPALTHTLSRESVLLVVALRRRKFVYTRLAS